MKKYDRIEEVDYKKITATLIMNDGTEYTVKYKGTYGVYYHGSVQPSIYGTHARDKALNALTRKIITIDKNTFVYPCNVKKIKFNDEEPNVKK